MADEDSPLPFRRERNLSNRNFNKRNSKRRISTDSHSSVQQDKPNDNESTSTSTSTPNEPESAGSSSFQISYSVNSDTEHAFNQRSLLKLRPITADDDGTPVGAPPTPDPAWLDVRQKVQHFETLKTTIRFKRIERDSLKMLENRTRHQNINNDTDDENMLEALRQLPVIGRLEQRASLTTTTSSPNMQSTSIDEVRSEDEVDNISDFEAEPSLAGEYTLPEEAVELKEEIIPTALPGYAACVGYTDEEVRTDVPELGIDNITKIETVKRSVSADPTVLNCTNNAQTSRLSCKDFPRNYRTTPRRKTEIFDARNRNLATKYTSLYQPKDEEEEEEIQLRDKHDCVRHILDELIKTEEAYVENLRININNYGNIFQRKDLPIGLRGKKYILFGNIEAIYEFHRDEFLPMLHRNRRDLKRLFDEFLHYIETNSFYGYVIFTMNKQKSLKLCETYKNYFKLIQNELDDKLGINSFLVQPIQRMARYPLLLTQFITTFFKNRDIVLKPLIESCCRLEKRLRTFLTTTNESEVINDIVDCHEFNVLYQGKFRKVSEFQVVDHTLKRSYRSKVFIFDKCIIYTEIKSHKLIFHGRYPCEHIGVSAKTKSFTLFYERRKQQECDFIGDPTLISTWLDLIREMLKSFATEERQKLQERYSRDNDHLHPKPPNLSLFRDSNRFSSDSGIGNIWVLPKPDEEQTNNRTTWYATS